MNKRSPIEEVARKIRDGEPLSEVEREKISKTIMAVAQHFYEKSGAMFICGYSGDIGSDRLPQNIFVSPSLGADDSCVVQYVKKV